MSRKGVLIFTLATLSALLLQASILPLFFIHYFKPDLLLVIMVFVALRCSYQSGIPAVILLGLLKDSFNGLYLGLNVFSFLVIFLVIKGLSDRIYAESSHLFVLAVTMATLACIGTNLLLLMFTPTPGIAFSIGSSLLPHLLCNAFAASLVALVPAFDQNGEGTC